ncbi:MAG: M1 family aminopeptidase [Gemmatimonadales bacterium]
MSVVIGLALVLAAPPQTPYDTIYDQLKSLVPRSVARVHGLVVRRDVMELRLDSGYAHLLSPVAGRIVGVAFSGYGSLSFTPPLAIEQRNVQRVMGDSTVSGPISAAVFLFADSTEAELTRALRFIPEASVGVSVAAPIAAALDYLVDGHTHLIDDGLIDPLLNGARNGFFAAYFQRRRGESVMIQIDPAVAEEVSLYRRGRMLNQRVETVCQFQRAEDLLRAMPVTAEQPEPLRLDGSEVDATVDGGYKFSARATLRLTGQHNAIRWGQFSLFDELDVDSVTTGAGAPLAYYRHDREARLWIRFAQPVNAGDIVSVRVVYHGGLIGFGSAIDEFLPPWWDPLRRQLAPVLDGWAFIKSLTDWYPRYAMEKSAPIALTFHTPSRFKFATIGRLIDSSTTGDVTTTRWVSEAPTRFVAFNIGNFEQLDIRDPRIPPVTVHVNTAAHRIINGLIPGAKSPEVDVGADVANSLAFFSQVFGPPLFDHYYATEIPYFGDGYAFPGLIQLSWWSFMGRSQTGNAESFRAHEMAHQWWGIGVEPASYRDWWLSEGFAEFGGLWYMQTILNDNARYFEKLRLARDAIRHQRGKAAPIGLGLRATENRRGQYALMTYSKGAWVLHMLRNMMLDVHNMSEDRFKAMMRDFYTTYRGKQATTLDFQHVVERHIGQPMDWFFDEWVNETDIPTYFFSWTASRDGGGYTAQLRVRQSDVPDNFGMYVPVLIKFAEGEAIIRMLVRGPTTEATLRLPNEPRSMQLNPLESVLADVKTEAYR